MAGSRSIPRELKHVYLVIIAWLYVAVLMAVAEAMSSNGTLLGAIVTFFLYGLMPIALVVYLMGTPLRRKARARQDSEAATTSATPDAGDHAPGAAEAPVVAPVREKP